MKKFLFNALTGKFDLVDYAIPQYNDTDPTSPASHDVWIKKTSAISGGEVKAFIGFWAITATTPAVYQLSYRNEEGTTKRITLS